MKSNQLIVLNSFNIDSLHNIHILFIYFTTFYILIFNIFRLAALYCNAALAETESQYIEKITKSPGILFDPVGTLRIINDHFHIVIPTEIIPIQHHLENFHEVFGTIRFYCRENDEINISECHNMLQPLEALFNDIQRDFQSISHIISNGISKRSAWFGVVGTVFKHIFGTLDEDDARNYDNAVQALYNNDKKLADSLTKSIIVSQSAISNINKSLMEINVNQAKLSDVIDQLTTSIVNVTHAVNAISLRNRLSNILNVLQSNLLTISFKVEDLLNSILFVKSNTLHPSILTPNQLFNDIISNLKVIPKYRDFPVNLDISNIHTLINIADLTCYYLNDKLMFIVKLPLVSLQQFSIYKNIPLPTPHANGSFNSFAMILPSEQFLALSTDRLSYTYLKDLNNCKNILTETYLCEITDVYAVLNSPSCEIEIITKTLSSLPDNCPYKLIFGNIDIWHKLNNNKWVYIQSEPTKLTIDCNQKLSEVVISGTGVLNIPPECVAFHKNVKLITKVYPNITVPAVSSDFNIINDSCCSFNRLTKINVNISNVKIKSVNLENLKNFKAVSDQIVNDVKNLDNPTNFNNHISFPILSILSIIVVLSFITFYCYRKRKFSIKITTNPVQEQDPENSNRTSQPQLRFD